MKFRLFNLIKCVYYTIKIGVAFFFIGACIYTSCKEYIYHPANQKKSFDSNAWKMMDHQAKKSPDALMLERCYMYNDLINHHIKLGMNYQNILEILGHPMSIDFYQKKNNNKIKVARYYLGNCIMNPSTNSHTSLFLYFDQNSSLIDFEDSLEFFAKPNNKLKNPEILDNTKELASCTKEDLEGQIYECYTSTHNAKGKLEDVLTALNVKAW